MLVAQLAAAALEATSRQAVKNIWEHGSVHPQVPVTVVYFDGFKADVEIAPLVDILSKWGFRTLYSCQGEDYEDIDNGAHIMFVPFRNELDKLRELAIATFLFKQQENQETVKIEVVNSLLSEPLRFNLKFSNKSAMLRFTKFIQRVIKPVLGHNPKIQSDLE